MTRALDENERVLRRRGKVRGVRDAGNPAQEVERKPLAPASALAHIADNPLFLVRHLCGEVFHIGGGKEQEAVYAAVVRFGKVADDLVRAERMPCEHDVAVARTLRPVDVGADVLGGVGEPLVP